jgi:hypothetical protein
MITLWYSREILGVGVRGVISRMALKLNVIAAGGRSARQEPAVSRKARAPGIISRR